MKTGAQLLSTLQERIVVADGAFGTQLYAKGVPPTTCYDMLNITNPSLIASIHHEYMSVGAELIETNTFGANRVKLAHFNLADRVKEINREGARVALECARENAWVAGSMGPLGRVDDDMTDEEKKEIFKEHAEGLIEGGVRIIIIETFNDVSDILLALEAVKSVDADVLVITQMVVTNTGKTIAGDDVLESFLALEAAGASIVGVNCGVGPKGILDAIRVAAKRVKGYVSVFPNAGFPQQVEDRMIYLSNADYFADTGAKLVEAGVNLIGGCCGSSPEDIRLLKEKVAALSPAVKAPITHAEYMQEREKKALEKYQISQGHLKELLTKKEKKVISVELDPPKNLAYEQVIEGALAVKEAGGDVISIAENPLAIVRMSNLSMATMIEREVGIETVVHVSGRDRNLLGLQSMLMGIAVDGIKNVLAITGDPPSSGGSERVKGVFDARSYELISLVKRLNEGENYYGDDIKKKTAFFIGAAFNPNTTNIDLQVERMHKKIERGAEFFQTQPVFSFEKIDELIKKTEDVDAPILLGVLPLLNGRNADFLHNEFPGITIPEDVRARMRNAGENGEEEGKNIAFELIKHAYPHVDGIYIMPPFNKYELAVDLITRIKQEIEA